MSRSFLSFNIPSLQRIPEHMETADKGSSSPFPMNMNKSQALCAGATGLWLLAAKTFAYSRAVTVDHPSPFQFP